MTIKWDSFLIHTLMEFAINLILSAIFIFFLARPALKTIIGRTIKRLMSEKYNENIWEMMNSAFRINPNVMIENSMRAASGKIIARPLGSPRKFTHFERLVFSPAQLFKLPAFANAPVEMKITIGPNAKKPLTLDIPIMAAGMGYAVSVNSKVKRAIARATAATGTATNSGHGAFLPEERELAKYFILQYSPSHWAKSQEILAQADAIEIRIGQGASAAASYSVPPEELPGDIRETFQLLPNETLIVPSRFETIDNPEDLKTLVDHLREVTGGIPIGVKMAGSGEIEKDMDICIQAGVDFISIDGSQAGTKGAAPILQDDFGLPTIYSLSRAVQYLHKKGVKSSISLLAGGGFNTPSDCLKAIALGADAVYIGTAILFAMSHDQITKTLPWEPPTQLIFYSGKMKDKFDEEKAVYYLVNYLNSSVEEMKEAIRSLGKSSIQEISSDDLIALDELTSSITKVRLGYKKI